MSAFPTDLASIRDRVEQVKPIKYGRSRNFLDGDVTRLSPYISRGVISTKQVFKSVLERGFDPYHMEKFVQELAWRDYWQQVWKHKGDEIEHDLKRQQPEFDQREMPAAIVKAGTGIKAIDSGIDELYESGYMHNHLRMYTASIACNIGRSHWREPARWMYYHLLDGDWASNNLSWQWVAGSNSNKKYYANQQNINKYCKTRQGRTFLDVDYSEFEVMQVPEELKETKAFEGRSNLPETAVPAIDSDKPTLVYTYYNMDPEWRKELDANRVLLLEPSVFDRYPVSDKCIRFVQDLMDNIPGIQLYTEEFNDLQNLCADGEIIFKEHPLSKHYRGTEDPRDWMFGVEGYFPSFFGFWKRCRKRLPEFS